jgi:hypothetical protein
MMGSRTKDLLAHIKANLAPPDANGCEVWLLSCKESGHGQLRHLGKCYKVHRLRYQLEVGPLAPGQVVRHKCDNPPCAALDHLIPGTQADNVQDMISRGRAVHVPSHGEKHGCSKLTEEQVRAIRADPRGCVLVARAYGISKTNVKAIRRRKLWRHLS